MTAVVAVAVAAFVHKLFKKKEPQHKTRAMGYCVRGRAEVTCSATHRLIAAVSRGKSCCTLKVLHEGKGVMRAYKQINKGNS